MIVHAIKTAPICIKLDNAYAGVSFLGGAARGAMAPPDFDRSVRNFCEISTVDLYHRRQKYGRCSPNSLRPISYFWSIWELYVLDLKSKVFCRKENQLHFPMDKGLTVPK